MRKREEEIVNEQLLSEYLCMNLTTGGQGGHISIEYSRKGAIATCKILNERFKTDKDFREKIH